jgi:hypothetical protein
LREKKIQGKAMNMMSEKKRIAQMKEVTLQAMGWIQWVEWWA